MSSEYVPDQVLGHADEADGIEEYDNRLPAWWLWLFYFTIGAAVWVFVDWHMVSPKSLAMLYDDQVEDAREQYGEMAPVEVVMADDRVAAGQALFATNCVACHQADGRGNEQYPDLTDSEWIHGGTPDEINHTIFYGVIEKGMLAWGPILGAEDVASLAAYVHGLGGGQ